MTPENTLVVFSGGPGAGKTTVLAALEQRGYAVVPEVARRIIAERKAQGLSPRPSPIEFAQAILAEDAAQYAAASRKDGWVFFDRSALDALGSLFYLGELSDERKEEMLARFAYHPTVFVFPPWQEIYRTDSERDQTYDEAVRVYNSIRSWYSDCGYALVEVPPGTVDERCDFVLEALGLRPAAET